MPSLPTRASALLLASVLMVAAIGARAEPQMKRIATQYIAALGDKTATSGDDAATWGLWAVDPGPRGVFMDSYAKLVADGGKAPEGWRFDPQAWWIEEHGLIMETPAFPIPAGRYVVTGGRQVTSVLTVDAPDAGGKQHWSLADGASIYDVTHIHCRAAVYTPVKAGASCTPDKTPMSAFPMSPGLAMPSVEGCAKKDYQVLIVIGMMVDA